MPIGSKTNTLHDGEGNPIQSSNGAMDVHIADVHEVPVSDYMHLHDGITTTLTTAIAVGDTSINVVSATGFVVGHHVHILNGNNELLFPKITGIAANVITVDSPFSNAFTIADTSIEHVIINIANTVGSLAAPISYKVMPTAGEHYHLLRLIGSAVCDSDNDDGTFCGLPALANGCVIRKYDGTTGKFSKFTAWHDNNDIISDMFDVVYSDAPKFGKFGLRFRWTLSKVGVAIKLNGDAGDYIEILIQDDLTGLEIFNLMVHGHFKE